MLVFCVLVVFFLGECGSSFKGTIAYVTNDWELQADGWHDIFMVNLKFCDLWTGKMDKIGFINFDGKYWDGLQYQSYAFNEKDGEIYLAATFLNYDTGDRGYQTVYYVFKDGVIENHVTMPKTDNSTEPTLFFDDKMDKLLLIYGAIFEVKNRTGKWDFVKLRDIDSILLSFSFANGLLYYLGDEERVVAISPYNDYNQTISLKHPGSIFATDDGFVYSVASYEYAYWKYEWIIVQMNAFNLSDHTIFVYKTEEVRFGSFIIAPGEIVLGQNRDSEFIGISLHDPNKQIYVSQNSCKNYGFSNLIWKDVPSHHEPEPPIHPPFKKYPILESKLSFDEKKGYVFHCEVNIVEKTDWSKTYLRYCQINSMTNGETDYTKILLPDLHNTYRKVPGKTDGRIDSVVGGGKFCDVIGRGKDTLVGYVDLECFTIDHKTGQFDFKNVQLIELPFKYVISNLEWPTMYYQDEKEFVLVHHSDIVYLSWKTGKITRTLKGSYDMEPTGGYYPSFTFPVVNDLLVSYDFNDNKDIVLLNVSSPQVVNVLTFPISYLNGGMWKMDRVTGNFIIGEITLESNAPGLIFVVPNYKDLTQSSYRMMDDPFVKSMGYDFPFLLHDNIVYHVDSDGYLCGYDLDVKKDIWKSKEEFVDEWMDYQSVFVLPNEV